MATYEVPQNAGKFIVVMTTGGAFAVWNRKHDKNEVSIRVRTRKQAEMLCAKLNQKDRPATISVWN